uniref:60S ribosomal export protein NMD3 n=1 Tax=Branchiostoma floridae TaxID=7739 RepID=C3ZPJ6_BRAFL|eukprot:XP_002589482.1 hypothetical protein BRAFLDRAFT_125192 [Branchiostoma floridae]
MEYLPDGDGVSFTQGNILCCQCGVPIQPNPANMCVACLRTQVHLIDAGFVWTEPHSKRIKLKLTIQKEVVNGAILQQVFVVEFVVSNQMYKTSEKLLSHDVKSNTYNYKSTFSVEIVPVCKDNIVCLPPKLAQQLGNLNQICVCLRVSTTVHIIDPSTLQIADVTAPVFWRTPFQSLCEPRQLTEYMVLEVEPIRHHERVHVAGEGAKSHKHLLADVWVARSSDLGMNDNQYHCRTHLGHLLRAGDLVHGFDLSNANVNNDFLDKMKADRLPDVVLVKKVFDKSKRHRRRNWKLKRLAKELETMDTDSMERDYNEFLEDLEEDPLYRKDVNIYRDAEKLAVESDTDDDDAPRISLQEMLEDLHISEDATGGEGADMMTD